VLAAALCRKPREVNRHSHRRSRVRRVLQGAIRTIAPLAAPHERAGVLSIIYVASYVALGLPAILAGVLVVHGGSILITSREYGATIMLLAALAMLRLIVQRHRPRRRQAPINRHRNPAAEGCSPITATAPPTQE
jgi:MFS family permease